ncbi:MAG: hypothetical protein L7U61_05540 [Flavobacteriaceae bacterium]|nr:hypothetical protein [Flavobacteriaceae bacterium]
MEKNLEYLIRLNQLAETVYANKFRVAVLLEGRDGAGKSGTIRELTRYLPPYTHRVMPSFMPTKRMMKAWIAGWSKLMPKQGEIVFYDRSYYSRALLQPVMGWCSENQYDNFMKKVIEWEQEQPILFVKLWLSVDEDKQRNLLKRRANDPLRYWKYSPNDEKAVSAFDKLTVKKEKMFELGGWNIIDMENRFAGRNQALKTVVEKIEQETSQIV